MLFLITAMLRSSSESILSDDSGIQLDNIDSIDVCCMCHACGKKEFSHCLFPPSECMSVSFPELDLKTGSNPHKAKQIANFCLQKQTKKIKVKFIEMSMRVYHFAKSIPDSNFHLRRILIMQGLEDPGHDFEVLYICATQNASFINFEVIKHILNVLKLSYVENEVANEQLALDADAAYREYEKDLMEYCKHRVFFNPHIEEVLVPQHEQYSTLIIKIENEFTTFRLDQVFMFKRLIRDTLEIPENVFLNLKSVEEGCVSLIFVMPRTFCVEKLNNIQKRKLAIEKIVFLQHAENFLYCCCDLFEDEVSECFICVCITCTLVITLLVYITLTKFPY